MTSDALRPRVSPSGPFEPGAGGEFVIKVHEGDGIAVDNTDQQNPVVSNLGLLSATQGPGIEVSTPSPGLLKVSAVLDGAYLRTKTLDLVVPTSGGNDQFFRVTAVGGDFTLVDDTAGGVFTLGNNAELTYAGAARKAMIWAAATLEVGAADVRTLLDLCIDINGATVGQATFSAAALAAGQQQTMAGTTITVFQDLTLATSRLVTLAPNDVISPTFARVNNSVAAADISLQLLALSILLL